MLRKDLPQINSSISLDWARIPYRFGNRDLRGIEFVQTDTDETKIEQIVQQIKWLKLTPTDFPPIIMIGDKLLDGNHRALAYIRVWGKEIVVPVVWLDVTWDTAMICLKDYVPGGGSVMYDRTRLKESRSIDWKKLDSYLDRLFSVIGADVTMSKHFKDRVFERNIDVNEFVDAMKAFFAKYKFKITQLDNRAERLIKHIQTNLNIPFVIYVRNNGNLDVMLKTIMKKQNFTSTTPAYIV